MHTEKWIYFLQTVFIRSSLLWKVKEDSHKPRYTRSFSRCLKRIDSQNLKSSSSSVYAIGTTCLDNDFLFHVIFIVILRLFSTVMFSVSVKQMFERSPYFILYFYNNNAMLISEFQNEPLLYHEAVIYFLNFLN